MKIIFPKNSKFLYSLVWWIVLIFGLALLILSFQCGIGITNDSKFYLEIASDFRKMGLIQGLESHYLIAKPPLFPLFLCTMSWMNYSLLYIILFLVNALLAYLLIKETIINPNLRLIAWLLIVVSLPNYLMHNFLLSEPLYMVFFLLIQILFLQIIEKINVYYLLGLILGIFLLCLTRHSGIFILIGLSVGLFIIHPKSTKYIFLFLFLSLALTLTWYLYQKEGTELRINQIIAPIVNMKPGMYFTNFYGFIGSITKWILPIKSSILIVSIIILLIVMQIYLVSNYSKNQQLHKFFIVNMIIVYLYIFFMSSVFTIPASAFDRYSSPLYLLFILFTIFMFEQNILRRKTQYIKFFYMLLIVWSSITIIRAYKNCFFWYENRCNDKMEVFTDANW